MSHLHRSMCLKNPACPSELMRDGQESQFYIWNHVISPIPACKTRNATITSAVNCEFVGFCLQVKTVEITPRARTIMLGPRGFLSGLTRTQWLSKRILCGNLVTLILIVCDYKTPIINLLFSSEAVALLICAYYSTVISVLRTPLSIFVPPDYNLSY